MINPSYTDFKDFVISNGYEHKVKCIQEGDYTVLYVNAGIEATVKIHKDESYLADYIENLSPFVNEDSEFVNNLPFASKVIQGGGKLYRRKHGYSYFCDQNENNIDMIVPYTTVRIDTIEIIGCEEGDRVDLIVLDSETGIAQKGMGLTEVTPFLPLNQFGFDVALTSESYTDTSKYDAQLYQGMVVRLVYKLGSNNGAKTIYSNIVFHEIKND